MSTAKVGGLVEQGSAAWYIQELRTLSDNITGRGVGICNGAALMLERKAALTAHGQPVVDEDAVTRALRAFGDAMAESGFVTYGGMDVSSRRKCIAAALTAALAGEAQ